MNRNLGIYGFLHAETLGFTDCWIYYWFLSS